MPIEIWPSSLTIEVRPGPLCLQLAVEELEDEEMEEEEKEERRTGCTSDKL